MTTNVVVIGQGYVGLPLALEAANSGFSVVGIDNNLAKVEELTAGRSTVEDISNEALKRA